MKKIGIRKPYPTPSKLSATRQRVRGLPARDEADDQPGRERPEDDVEPERSASMRQRARRGRTGSGAPRSCPLEAQFVAATRRTTRGGCSRAATMLPARPYRRRREHDEQQRAPRLARGDREHDRERHACALEFSSLAPVAGVMSAATGVSAMPASLRIGTSAPRAVVARARPTSTGPRDDADRPQAGRDDVLRMSERARRLPASRALGRPRMRSTSILLNGRRGRSSSASPKSESASMS